MKNYTIYDYLIFGGSLMLLLAAFLPLFDATINTYEGSINMCNTVKGQFSAMNGFLTIFFALAATATCISNLKYDFIKIGVAAWCAIWSIWKIVTFSTIKDINPNTLPILCLVVAILTFGGAVGLYIMHIKENR